MTNSRAKGAAGERELAERLREMGYKARRTQQYCGKAGDADVVVEEMPGIHVECKRVQRLNIHEAMQQAATDAAPSGRLPTVWHRKNGSDWLVTVSMSDLHQFSHLVCEAMKERKE